MPFARLTLQHEPSVQTRRLVAEALTQSIADLLGKRYELTSVLIETAHAGVWTVGASEPQSAAHLEVRVTAGTNTPAQKRAFVAAATTLLRRYFVDLPLATYVVVMEVPGTDWGYDGRTQADRAASTADATSFGQEPSQCRCRPQ
ncbi:tautomerase family protein [Chitinasiproducens palmae]|uniref:4-oxalocrotonate tautomerase n=1 Tax=Chitinasiproducens palmae TaxID=1770053 RepID=A0A1H2PLP9_9BURK|nr:tautomerase family protein [Chitinasiproducens palmae]SDV47454.1 4-oxalocrotonate tautomerase [Chitinasiproducens palmae]